MSPAVVAAAMGGATAAEVERVARAEYLRRPHTRARWVRYLGTVDRARALAATVAAGAAAGEDGAR